MTRRLEQLSLAEMGRVKSIHFVGVGGSGMSGIAEVLVNQGFEISGSDLAESKVTQRLRSLGVKCLHRASGGTGGRSRCRCRLERG